MNDLSDLKDLEPAYVMDKLPEIIPTKIDRYSDQWIFKCPICGDSKKRKNLKRGHYYIKNNSYYCFNEQCSASGLWIVAKIADMTITDVRKDFMGYVAKHSKKRKDCIATAISHCNNNTKVISKHNEKPNNIDILISERSKHWIDLPAEINTYLTDRKVFNAPYLPKNYKFYWNTFNERLVIPWMDNGKIIYYQERLMEKDAFAKYIFPKDISRPVVGLDKIDDQCHHIFMMEGFLDHIWVPSCVCIGSIHLSDHQKYILEQYGMHKTVFFPDNQWTDPTSYKISRKIALDDQEQLVFVWPRDIKDKDVNAYVMNNSINIFNDVSFLQSRMFKGIRAVMELDRIKF
jgi:hypothetical protein